MYQHTWTDTRSHWFATQYCCADSLCKSRAHDEALFSKHSRYTRTINRRVCAAECYHTRRSTTRKLCSPWFVSSTQYWHCPDFQSTVEAVERAAGLTLFSDAVKASSKHICQTTKCSVIVRRFDDARKRPEMRRAISAPPK